ncbi:unnamed protein product [[Candida] boidinii]|uniref:Unnamed protein product n=1 Tax=Candida boidinii TaxID=5477 RepID=A0A9W6T1Q8_CANBO|nr:unnamed protein product [[Candida] boidinii]
MLYSETLSKSQKKRLKKKAKKANQSVDETVTSNEQHEIDKLDPEPVIEQSQETTTSTEIPSTNTKIHESPIISLSTEQQKTVEEQPNDETIEKEQEESHIIENSIETETVSPSIEEHVLVEEPVQEPITVEQPIVEEDTVVQKEPIVQEKPIVQEEPVHEEPVTQEEPVAHEEPAQEDIPVKTQAEEPIDIKDPIAIEEPTPLEKPIAVEEPVVIDEQVVTKQPSELSNSLAAQNEVDELFSTQNGNDTTDFFDQIAKQQTVESNIPVEPSIDNNESNETYEQINSTEMGDDSFFAQLSKETAKETEDNIDDSINDSSFFNQLSAETKKSEEVANDISEIRDGKETENENDDFFAELSKENNKAIETETIQDNFNDSSFFNELANEVQKPGPAINKLGYLQDEADDTVLRHKVSDVLSDETEPVQDFPKPENGSKGKEVEPVKEIAKDNAFSFLEDDDEILLDDIMDDDLLDDELLEQPQQSQQSQFVQPVEHVQQIQNSVYTQPFIAQPAQQQPSRYQPAVNSPQPNTSLLSYTPVSDLSSNSFAPPPQPQFIGQSQSPSFNSQPKINELIAKLGESKKKSDAYDFPMDLLAKKSAQPNKPPPAKSNIYTQIESRTTSGTNVLPPTGVPNQMAPPPVHQAISTSRHTETGN